MKLLFDANLSYRLVSLLSDLYPESMHVRDAGLDRASDLSICAYAATHGFTIVSKDADFSDQATRRGHPPKVTWVRLGNCSTAEIVSLLREQHDTLLRFERDRTALRMLS